MRARQIVQAIRVVGALVCVSGVHAGGECELHEIAQLVASEAMADAEFGNCVAISGDTVVVGARQEPGDAGVGQGAAYVYLRFGRTWTFQARLTASDAAISDNFGVSVDIDGDTIVVGAYGDDGPDGIEYGAAYVFFRTGSVWVEQAKLTASDGDPLDYFGNAVAIEGDTVIVGAHEDEGPAGISQGAAYVFVRNRGVWIEQVKLTPTDASAGDRFGNAVALNADTALISAPYDDGSNGPVQGSAYIFVRDKTSWAQQAKLTASDGATYDHFGLDAVAIAGDTAIVGAYSEDGPAGRSQGSAYVFVRNGSKWTEQVKLTASDGATSDYFGCSVAIDGDTAIVGAFFDDGPVVNDQGSAYLFVRDGETWTQQVKLTASNPATDDRLGYSVAIDEGTIILGAIWSDGSGMVNQGSAYLYEIDPIAVYPSIGQNPVAQVVLDAHPVAFSIVASSPAPIAYQWRRNGEPLIDGGPIHGATTSTLTINPVQPDDAGSYDVVVSNECAVVVSDPATLTVTPLAPADLNQDGVVNTLDLGILLSFWGPVGVFPAADINGDGTINSLDLGILLSSWTL